MLQAVDLVQLESDLQSSNVVMIEIFADLWPGLIKRLEERMHHTIPAASVFMTAVDRQTILDQTDDRRAGFIEGEVRKILSWRRKDDEDKIQSRAKSAVKEILSAICPKDGQVPYAEVFNSAPEGPDGEDEWTKGKQPMGRAKQVLDEFVTFFNTAVRPGSHGR
jgi:hypothetical protein